MKIGYQAGIKLLRAGAHLIVTTRFPRDSAARYGEHRHRFAAQARKRIEQFASEPCWIGGDLAQSRLPGVERRQHTRTVVRIATRA